MNSGSMKHRIVFQSQKSERDREGFPVTGNVVYTKAWAELKTLKGKSLYDAAQSNTIHNRQFLIRYQSSLDDNKRPKNLQVHWNGMNHDIVSIENDDGLKRTMTVVVRAVR
jgi:SPP1 family predicted phage head-tail adaptor